MGELYSRDWIIIGPINIRMSNLDWMQRRRMEIWRRDQQVGMDQQLGEMEQQPEHLEK